MELQLQERILLLLSLFFTISLFQLQRTSAAKPNGEDFIRKSCNASLYPDLCFSALSQFAGQVQQSPEKLAAVSISFSLSKVEPVKAYISDISGKTSDPKLSQSLKQCVENLEDAIDSIQQSIDQMKNMNQPGAISNVQTWMSAALTDEDTCLDSIKGVPNEPVKEAVINRTEEVEKFTSIALAMVNLYAHS